MSARAASLLSLVLYALFATGCTAPRDTPAPPATETSASPLFTATWTRQLPTEPSPRVNPVVVFDSQRQRLVVFGGTVLGNNFGAASRIHLNDTREWDGTAWLDRTQLQQLPPGRTDPAYAYDSDRHRTVMFGGTAVAGTLGDTWEYDGTLWQPRISAPSPPPGAGYPMAYDPIGHRVIMVVPSSTWQWDGTAWTLVTTATPAPPSSGARLAWDSRRNVGVLYAGPPSGAIWELDGGSWSTPPQGTPLPPPRTPNAFFYDDARQSTVLLGGFQSPNSFVDHWLWNGTSWLNATPATPRPPTVVGTQAAVYDATRGVTLLLQHGTTGGLWEFDGGTWSKRLPPDLAPRARDNPGLAWDSNRSRWVLFGGRPLGASVFSNQSLGDTWEWDGTQWRDRTNDAGPPSQGTPTIGYDPDRGRTVMLGTAARGDVWEWDGTSWFHATPDGGPPPRGGAPFVFDTRKRRMLLAGTASVADAWEWNGTTWTNVTPDSGFPPPDFSTARVPAAWDDQRERLVVRVSEQTWEWDGARWSNRTTLQGPSARSTATLAFDPMRGRVILAGGTPGEDAFFGDVWEWDGTTWLPVPPQGPRWTPRRVGGLAWNSARSTLMLFGGLGTEGATNDLWEATLSLANGTACSAASECFSGFCVDGTCCASACAGGPDDCQACNVPGAAGRCSPRPSTVQCRGASGPCDLAERCTGDAGTCPADGFVPAGQRCAVASGACDVDDVCSGSGSACPPAFADAGTVCRADVDVCDAPEVCTGDEPACPPDALRSSGQPCRPAVGPCDVSETCNGLTTGCPADALTNAGVPCGAAVTGACDAPDVCTGQSPSCIEAVLPRGVVCRAVVGSCDVADLCDGTSSTCGDDALLAPGTVCEAEDSCHEAAACDGASGRCPPAAVRAVPGCVPTSSHFAFGCSASGNSAFGLIVLVGLALRRRRSARRSALLLAALGACHAPAPASPPPAAHHAPLVAEVSKWTQVQPFDPSQRWRPAFGYDPARQRVVMYGGQYNIAPQLTDTWEWNGSFWYRASTDAGGPAARGAATMAWDEHSGRLLIFGGDSISVCYGDTWAWNGAAWTQVAVAGPLPRTEHAMVTDPVRHRIVLYGGQGCGPPFPPMSMTDTWELADAGWQQRSTSGPLLADVKMTFDELRGRPIIVGVTAGDAGQTWEWNGSTWVDLNSPIDAPRGHWALTWDSQRQRAVLQAGLGDSTWEWDGGTWSPRFDGGLAPRWGPAITYDSARTQVVLFGGSRPGFGFQYSDTWTWDGARWSQHALDGGKVVPARTNYALSYDPLRQRAVLFGGSHANSPEVLGDTWEWDGTRWLDQSPAADAGPRARRSAAMTWDSNRQRSVLVGGVDETGASLGDTWAWDGVQWQALPVIAAPPRSSHALAYDEHRGVMVMFGGTIGTLVSEVWEWDGGARWVNQTPAFFSPVPRIDSAMIYDPGRQKVLMTGGRNIGPVYSDVWAWDGVTWEDVTPVTGRATLAGPRAATWDPTTNRLVIVAPPTGAGTSLGLFALAAEEWSPLPPVGATPEPRASPGLFFDATRQRFIVFGGFSGGHWNDVWEATRLGGLGAPCAGAVECGSGFCADGVCCDSACSSGAADCLSCDLPGLTGRCLPVAAATVCRTAAGPCDLAEACDGDAGACPADVFVDAGAVCNPVRGDCDVEDVCSGAGAACPAQFVAAGSPCRPSRDLCDAPESCTGNGPGCPADAVASAGQVCRPATRGCDRADTCDGVSRACGADEFLPAGALCRPTRGRCDVAELCGGGTPDCPSDVLEPQGVECRAATGPCDVAEVCGGSEAECPADALAAEGAVCTADGIAGRCDGVATGCEVETADAGRGASRSHFVFGCSSAPGWPAVLLALGAWRRGSRRRGEEAPNPPQRSRWRRPRSR